MPAKSKGTKALKASKENACVKPKQKIKAGTELGQQRKVLGDKTNSASDDNASILTCEKPPKTVPVKGTSKKIEQVKNLDNLEANERPRRARRLPTRYIENNAFSDTLSSKKSNSPPVITSLISPNRKLPVVFLTPLKNLNKTQDNSLIVNRPRRICRLPSRFDDNVTSPSKFLPVQPINTSTPLAVKSKTHKQGKTVRSPKIVSTKTAPKNVTKRDCNRKCNGVRNTCHTSPKQSQITSFLKKKTADTNNNAKNKNNTLKSVRKSPVNKSGINNSKTERNKIKEQDSIRILDDKKSLKRNSNKLDVYEFTFDPSEEPPTKKKKKKNVVKKPSKPRKVNYKNNYEKNLAKALAALKNAVAPDQVIQKNDAKASDQVSIKKNAVLNEVVTNGDKVDNGKKNKLNQDNITNQNFNQDIVTRDENTVNNNYDSVRVEDIALDIQPDDNHNHSPVNTPNQPKTPIECNNRDMSNANDPLNLQELSFFDDQPAASSSMNRSIKHPMASPWRAEFGSLPIKWQVNTYVKPNMTPALESSFINFNDSKKKHVYTPIVAVNDTLPEVVESPNLKQTSIISFIKEVVDKSLNKKKKKSSIEKNNSLFEDVTNSFTNVENIPSKETSNSSKSSVTPKDVSSENADEGNVNNESSVEDKENEIENAAKTNNDKNMTYFGFDESEDQENTKLTKKKRRAKSNHRKVLQELNTFKGPIRPVLPIAAKTNIFLNFDKAKELENMKSATEPPVFPDMSIAGNTEVTNVDQTDVDDALSLHLFEDIEVVHHHKPIRKSYSKPKRVMFKQRIAVNSDDSNSDEDQDMSSEDELDQSFTLPTVQPKKAVKKRVTKKQKLSKKEEKEADAWAAGFNSMCEDIEEFDLVVE